MTKKLLKQALDALIIAEAGLADIGDADREPGDDLAWCEARAAQALELPRKAIAALQAAIAQPVQPAMTDAAFKAMCEQHHAESMADWEQPAQPADTTIDSILEGIDLWSGDTSMGWWETSDDVAFGASKLAEIKAFFAASQAQPAQPAERNFCETCGQRLGDADHIHTCTPPIAQSKRQPLTNEAIEILWTKLMCGRGSGDIGDFVRDVEAAHGIKA